MALLKEDRIAFSKKIVEAEPIKAIIDQSKQTLLLEKQKAEELDAANKRLVDDQTYLIDPYENEIERYDGFGRVHLTEAIIQASAARVVGNALYPNDINNPPPSLAPLTWTKDKPYARTAAVGKQNNETFIGPSTAEQSLTNTILTLINKIETDYTLIQRVTGERCVVINVPPPTDTIVSYPELVADYDSLLSNINTFRSYVLATQGIIWTLDPNPTRQAQNNSAITDINTIVAAVDTWLALPPFNNAHGQTTCSGFNSYNPALLGATRLQSGDLTALKNAMISRQSFVTTRVSQINGHLGSITQNLSTGEATGSGFYFNRWGFLLLRLSLFGGSLIDAKNFDSAIDAQDKQKAQIDLSKSTYSALLLVSALSAPSNNTRVVHVKDSSGLSAGDIVYIVSDTQEEIRRNIESIDGNRLTLSQEVPAKYRPNEFARLYKDLT